MAWIEGTEEQTMVVAAPEDRARHYFSHPELFAQCLLDLDFGEQVDPMIWRWVLNEKSEKGVSYKADYTVIYKLDGNQLEWQTLKGNMRTEGVARWTRVDKTHTEVYYRETIATDLPIPRLLAKVFGVIVAREIRAGVGGYLDNVRRWLEQPKED